MVIDKEEIEKQAKEILDKFAKALEKIEKESDESGEVERDEFERKESCISSNSKEFETGKIAFKEVNGNFKQRILENAPVKDEDFIIAEKGSWK